MEKIHIIAFEGLFSYWPFGMFVRKGLLEPLAKELPGKFTYSVYSWFWSNPTIPSDRKVIVVGHSFGGKRAVQFANEHRDEIAAVVTLDPRMQPPRCLHPRAYNFYQTGYMNGFRYAGSYFETKLVCGHVQVPSRVDVRELMKTLIVGFA